MNNNILKYRTLQSLKSHKTVTHNTLDPTCDDDSLSCFFFFKPLKMITFGVPLS